MNIEESDEHGMALVCTPLGEGSIDDKKMDLFLSTFGVIVHIDGRRFVKRFEAILQDVADYMTEHPEKRKCGDDCLAKKTEQENESE